MVPAREITQFQLGGWDGKGGGDSRRREGVEVCTSENANLVYVDHCLWRSRELARTCITGPLELVTVNGAQ